MNNLALVRTRRQFLSTALGTSLGTAALANLLSAETNGSMPLQFAPKARRVIYLFQSGAPSQLDLFDYKPVLNDRRATELPDSVRNGQRLTGMTATQTSFPVAPTIFSFAQYGQSRAWVSDLLPHVAKVVDDSAS